MRDGGVALVVIPIALVAGAIYLVILFFVRRHQLERLRLIAPGEFVFTFDSNRWFQAAVLELLRQEMIDSKAPTDDSNPLARGPRWLAASSRGIRIMRGYDDDPVVSLTWSMLGKVTSEMHVRKKRNSGADPSVTVSVHGSDGDIRVVLYSPNSGASPFNTLGHARAVQAELCRVRDAPPTARLV
jgi:hypothetical protein